MRTPARRSNLAVVVACALLAGACSDSTSGDNTANSTAATATTTTAATTAPTTTAPSVDAATVPGADWTVESPADHGMDPAALEAARTYAFAEGRNTQGVVVVRGGVIVAEWYADGADADSWAASWSMAKSFTSALVGIAISEGKIPSVDEPMTTYFPDWAGTPKESITLRNVLQMASGLKWNEAYDPAQIDSSDIISMVLAQPDELAFAASRPAEVDGGTRFSYSSGDAMLLSGVLEKATGMSVEEYARSTLLGPIGLDRLDWWRDARGHTLTYCCVDTTSRGFARFGLLFLHDGAWGDQQVVPESWVADSTTESPTSGGQYGYQWWLPDLDGIPPDIFYAAGHDVQKIFVIPSLDLVVVRNGTYGKDPGPPVADPDLFSHYPSSGLVEGRGTSAPDSWDDADFLRPIVASITDR